MLKLDNPCSMPPKYDLHRKILALFTGMLSVWLWLVCLLSFFSFLKNMATLFLPSSLPLGQPSNNMNVLLTINIENLSSWFFLFVLANRELNLKSGLCHGQLTRSLWQTFAFQPYFGSIFFSRLVSSFISSSISISSISCLYLSN